MLYPFELRAHENEFNTLESSYYEPGVGVARSAEGIKLRIAGHELDRNLSQWKVISGCLVKYVVPGQVGLRYLKDASFCRLQPKEISDASSSFSPGAQLRRPRAAV